MELNLPEEFRYGRSFLIQSMNIDDIAFRPSLLSRIFIMEKSVMSVLDILQGRPSGNHSLRQIPNRSVSPAKSSKLKLDNNQTQRTSPRRGSPDKSKETTEEDNNRPIYVMELPAVEHKFKCPECPHDTFRKSNFVHHAKTAHLKDYEIVYRCIGCQKDFDQIRDCLAHTTSCQSIQKVVDTREEKEKRKIRPPQDPYILELSKIQSLTTTAKKSVQLDSGETNDKQPADIEEVSTRATSSSDRDEQISGISSISRKRGVDDGSNEFLIKVPRRDDSFSCPDCNKRFDRQDRATKHFKTEHKRDISFTFECMHCDKRFDVLRNASIHAIRCPMQQPVVKRPKVQGQQPVALPKTIGSQPFRNGISSSHRPPSSFSRPPPTSFIGMNGPSAPPPRTSSSSTIDETNRWEVLFFTELGRSLVQNPQSAEALVKVVPIMQQITKEVVAKLGHPTD